MPNRVHDLVLNDGTAHNFRLAKAGASGRGIRLTVQPWERFALPVEQWRHSLFPFTAGLFPSKRENRAGYIGTDSTSLAPCDVSWGPIVAAPVRNALTFTSAVVQGTRASVFNGPLYVLNGRYVHAVSTAISVSTDKDTGASSVGTDMAVFNNELIVAAGQTASQWIWKRTTTTWSQDTTAAGQVQRDALGTVGDTLYGSVGNIVYSCTTAPLLNASWAVVDNCGSSTFGVHQILDAGGAVWAIKGDGAYILTSEGFKNQTPQLYQSPDSQGGRNCFTALGKLFVPWAGGLLEVGAGEAIPVGPEVVGRPGWNLRVWHGVEYGGDIYLLVHNESQNTQGIWKMSPDLTGITGRRYKYFEMSNQAASTNKGKWVAAFFGPTNPTICFGGGSNTTSGNNFKLGKGSGRDIDDSAYQYDAAANSIMSGNFWPAEGKSMACRFVGAEVLYKCQSASDAITLGLKVDDFFSTSATPISLLTTQEGGGSATLASTSSTRAILYAPPDSTAVGTMFNVVVTIDNNANQTGTARTQIEDIVCFGTLSPATTDVIEVDVLADATVRTGTHVKMATTESEVERQFRDWLNESTVVTGQIQSYEEGRTTRFLVKGVVWKETAEKPRTRSTVTPVRTLTVTLCRIDYAAAYAD